MSMRDSIGIVEWVVPLGDVSLVGLRHEEVFIIGVQYEHILMMCPPSGGSISVELAPEEVEIFKSSRGKLPPARIEIAGGNVYLQLFIYATADTKSGAYEVAIDYGGRYYYVVRQDSTVVVWGDDVPEYIKGVLDDVKAETLRQYE